MATLKSIKNKYLQASDGETLGVTTNTENVSTLGFKLASSDSLTKFNMKDGFVDAYQDGTGIDASASTAEGLTGGYYYGVGSTPVTASGGTITTDGSYTIVKYNSTGTYTA